MEEKPNDDEIPNYITELNTVRAEQEIASNPEVITRIPLTSENKTLLLKQIIKKIIPIYQIIQNNQNII